MASIAVATRMATNRRNSTSWMRQSTYTPIPKPSTTRRRRDFGGWVRVDYDRSWSLHSGPKRAGRQVRVSTDVDAVVTAERVSPTSSHTSLATNQASSA